MKVEDLTHESIFVLAEGVDTNARGSGVARSFLFFIHLHVYIHDR